MSSRFAPLLLLVLAALPAVPATAGQIASVPLSHPAGFQSVQCHIMNVGTKELVVDSFFIEDVNTTTVFGSSPSGVCTGFAPWTLPPGRGCSRELNVPGACNQPNACYCRAVFGGSAKSLRGNLVATVNASTTTLTSELK